MMKIKFLLLYLPVFLVMNQGCKKHTYAPHYPPPEWEVDTTALYPYSMTAVVKVPDLLKVKIGEGDMVAAFAGNECRGVGVQISTSAGIVFYVLIHGTASEQLNINFQFYNSSIGGFYKTEEAVDYVVDGNYGTPDEPAVLNDLQPTQ